LLDAGQLAYQISFEVCENHSIISMSPIRKVQMPQTSTDKQPLLPTIISPAQCSHNLSLLDAGPSLHQISY